MENMARVHIVNTFTSVRCLDLYSDADLELPHLGFNLAPSRLTSTLYDISARLEVEVLGLRWCSN